MDALNIPVCSQKVPKNPDITYEQYCFDMFDCVDALEPQTLCASATDQIDCTKLKNYKKVVDTYKQGIIDCITTARSCGNVSDDCVCKGDSRQTDLEEGIERADNGFCTWKNNKCQYIPKQIWPIVLIGFIVVIVALLIVGLIVRAIIRGRTTTNQIQNPIIAFSTPLTT